MYMREQYYLQPTESSPGTRNPGPERQRMATWSGDTQASGSMLKIYKLPYIINYFGLNKCLIAHIHVDAVFV